MNIIFQLLRENQQRKELNYNPHPLPRLELNEESKKAAVSIAGYVAKTLCSRSGCNHCEEKLIYNNKDNNHNHDKYLRLLSRGVSTVPTLALTDFIL